MMTTDTDFQSVNPTQALDAIEQALQWIWTDVDTEEHYKTVPRVTDALTHLATLRQQVADLVAENNRFKEALLKACGDDAETCDNYLESVGGHGA